MDNLISFKEDFTGVDLDDQLMGVPDSGLYWNQGIHPMINTRNLTQILPNQDITFNVWDNSVTYSNYSESKSISDIVVFDDNLYQSLTTNTNVQPDSSLGVDWLLTNENSLKIKMSIDNSKDAILGDLLFKTTLIENQQIYAVSDSNNIVSLSQDYSGWVFEPKGSDYVKITINKICLTAKTTDPQNLYVINQGRLIDTLVLNPNDGVLEFEDLNYSFIGKGKFTFLFYSQDVISENQWNDALKYSGFVCYPCNASGDIGGGDIPTDENINLSSSNNGLHFNVSAKRDVETYINVNINDFARLWQLRFALDTMTNILNNSYINYNNTERELKNETTALEAKDLNSNTVAKMYYDELVRTKAAIKKSFDKFTTAKPAKKYVMRRSTY